MNYPQSSLIVINTPQCQIIDVRTTREVTRYNPRARDIMHQQTAHMPPVSFQRFEKRLLAVDAFIIINGYGVVEQWYNPLSRSKLVDVNGGEQ